MEAFSDCGKIGPFSDTKAIGLTPKPFSLHVEVSLSKIVLRMNRGGWLFLISVSHPESSFLTSVCE